MKKVRDLPPEMQDMPARVQTPEYQEHLRSCVEEVGQVRLVKAFTAGREDNGAPLGELEYELLAACKKPIPTNLDEKHSLWEEGEEVCYAYGILTHRALIRWYLQPGQKGTWLMAKLTENGEQVLRSHESA